MMNATNDECQSRQGRGKHHRRKKNVSRADVKPQGLHPCMPPQTAARPRDFEQLPVGISSIWHSWHFCRLAFLPFGISGIWH
jgi:hypothetical protein